MKRNRKQAPERRRTKKKTGSSSTRSRKKVVTAAALSMAFVLEAAPGCGSGNRVIPVVAPTDARVEQVVGRDNAFPIMPPRDMRDVAIMPPREAGRMDGVSPDHRPDLKKDGPKIYPIFAPKFDKGPGKLDGPIIYPIIGPKWDWKIYPIIAPKFDKGTPKKG